MAPRSWQQDPVFALPAPATVLPAPDQLALIGQPRPVRVPAEIWQAWLTDPQVIARFETKRYRRGPHRCWPWLGAVSSTQRGSFHAASLPGRSRRGTALAVKRVVPVYTADG